MSSTEQEALRVDQGSVAFGPDAAYISPDLSFTDGHGDPDEWPEEDKTDLPSTAKTRKENIEARNAEVTAAIAQEKKNREERAKAAEEEAERSAAYRKQQTQLTDALTGVMTGAIAPAKSEPAKTSKASTSG